MFDLKKLIDSKKSEAEGILASEKTEDTAVFEDYLKRKESAIYNLVAKSEFIPEINHWKLKGPFRTPNEVELRLIPTTLFGSRRGSRTIHEKIVDDFNSTLKKQTPGLRVRLDPLLGGSTF